MEIEVKIRAVFTDGGAKKATLSLTLGGMVAIHSLSLIEREDGTLYLRMPGKLDSHGGYHDIAHPISHAARKTLESIVVKAYHDHLATSTAHL